MKASGGPEKNPIERYLYAGALISFFILQQTIAHSNGAIFIIIYCIALNFGTAIFFPRINKNPVVISENPSRDYALIFVFLFALPNLAVFYYCYYVADVDVLEHARQNMLPLFDRAGEFFSVPYEYAANRGKLSEKLYISIILLIYRSLVITIFMIISLPQLVKSICLGKKNLKTAYLVGAFFSFWTLLGVQIIYNNEANIALINGAGFLGRFKTQGLQSLVLAIGLGLPVGAISLTVLLPVVVFWSVKKKKIQ